MVENAIYICGLVVLTEAVCLAEVYRKDLVCWEGEKW